MAESAGIPIINKPVSVTPVSLVAEASASDDYVLFAEYLERAAAEVGVNFLGGFSFAPRSTSRDAGRNQHGRRCKNGRDHRSDRERAPRIDGIGCAKLVVFCNAVEENPRPPRRSPRSSPTKPQSG